MVVLHAVPAGGGASSASGRAPRKPRTKTVTQAASRGTKRELLVAVRNRLAKQVEDPKTSARDLAALSKRLMDIVDDIERIDAEDRGSASEDREARTNADPGDSSFDPSTL